MCTEARSGIHVRSKCVLVSTAPGADVINVAAERLQTDITIPTLSKDAATVITSQTVRVLGDNVGDIRDRDKMTHS
jgi:hypothetical protein